MAEAATTSIIGGDDLKSRYIATMNGALALAESIRRLAEAGLESASRDWDGEQRLASEIENSIGENGARLLIISNIVPAIDAPKVALAA